MSRGARGGRGGGLRSNGGRYVDGDVGDAAAPWPGVARHGLTL